MYWLLRFQCFLILREEVQMPYVNEASKFKATDAQGTYLHLQNKEIFHHLMF